MFRKFDETVQSNKIAKFLFENNFTAMDVNRIYCEVYKCEKLGLEYNLKNLIKETFELKRHSKRSLLNKRLDLNEVAPAQAPAQQNPNNKIIERIQGEIRQLLSVVTDPKKLEDFSIKIKSLVPKQAPAAPAPAPAPASNPKAPAAPASNPAAPAAPANKQPQPQAAPAPAAK